MLITISLAVVLGLLATGGFTAGGPNRGDNSGGAGGQNVAGGASRAAAGIAAKVDPGLVDVVSTLGYQQAQAAGTGLVLTPSGMVLTNNHVIEGATSISVIDIGNGRSYRATVVGYDITADIAVLQMHGAVGLDTVRLGNSSLVRVGQQVTALGNAGGRNGTPAVASGTVTGLDQTITATDTSASTSEQLAGLIGTNAALQPGDSGGPLVNDRGQVIGLDTAATSGYRFRRASSDGFAIPVNRAAKVSAQIEAGRSSAVVHIGPTAFMGLQLQWQRAPGSSGAYVANGVPGLPAARAGISAGDVLVSVGGTVASSSDDIQSVLERLHPGSRVTVSWNDQSGTTHTSALVLAAGPAQ